MGCGQKERRAGMSKSLRAGFMCWTAMVALFVGLLCLSFTGLTLMQLFCILLWVVAYGGLMSGSTIEKYKETKKAKKSVDSEIGSTPDCFYTVRLGIPYSPPWVPRICETCTIPHIENCPDCFGFGLKIQQAPGEAVPISAEEAHIFGKLPPWRHCSTCGSTPDGVLKTRLYGSSR